MINIFNIEMCITRSCMDVLWTKTFQAGWRVCKVREFGTLSSQSLTGCVTTVTHDSPIIHNHTLLKRQYQNIHYLVSHRRASLHLKSVLSLQSDSAPNGFSFSKALIETNPQKALYNNLIDAFPDGIQMAFAYGSGAFQQSNSKEMSQNMLDFIFVVDKPRRWHRLNLERHPHHYSLLKRLGPRLISKIQEGYGAGVYFNTLVPMQGRLVKYGVISTARLITDLLDWETLYISGRLHKPVSLIVAPTDEELVKALMVNLESAVHSALLLLPDMFTEEQFYMTIAGLSYAGDFRMSFAEDNNKVKNIVSANIPRFQQIYLPLISGQEHVTFWPAEGQLEQALTFHSRHHHLTRLPCQVLHGLLMQKYQVGVFPDLEEIIHLHAHDSECASHISRSIKQIVKRSSASQSLKGILTAGFFKSIRYSLAKVLKKLRSR